MDKNTVKPRSIPLVAPYSAATLHRFLSDHPKDAGVKIEGAFKTPVLKVRTEGPRKLDDSGREAWSFYLRYLHQRLVGTEQADKAGEEVEALLKKEPLKLSVGMLLVPLQKLMLAEQARLAKANGIVRRWLAHEKEVLAIAIGDDRGDEPKEKVEKDKAALETACQFLAKFSDCKDGEIDASRILDEAYGIGHQLSKEDLDALGIARLLLIVKAKDLSAYIGPEVPGLLDLCISANGRDKKEFRSDTQVKNVVANVVTAMTARTDNEEYLVPPSPRTVANRTNVRASIPEFAAPDKSSRRGSEKEKEADNDQARTTPPRKTPPATPKRGSPEGDSGLGRSSSGSSLIFPSSSASSSSGLSSASVAPGMSATVRELKALQRPVLRKVITSPVDQGSTTSTATAPLPISGSSDTATDATSEKRQLRRASMRSRAPANDHEQRGQASETVVGTADDKKSRAEPKRKRALERDSATPGPARQKSAEGETVKVRTRVPHSSRGKHSSMPTVSMLDPDNEAHVQRALEELKVVASAAKADRLQPRTDSPIYKKWEAAEKELGGTLTLETSQSMRRILSFCHQVDLKRDFDPSRVEKIVQTVRPTKADITVLVSVRSLLFAELLELRQTKVMESFPELLPLLVYLLDAGRAWRQAHAAQGSD